jgi:hypothetical protein
MITEVRERLDVGGCPNTKRNKEGEANNRPPQHRAVARVHSPNYRGGSQSKDSACFRRFALLAGLGVRRPGKAASASLAQSKSAPEPFTRRFVARLHYTKVSARRRPFTFCFLPNDYDCTTQENLRTVRRSISVGMPKPRPKPLSPTACQSLWNVIVSGPAPKKNGRIPEDTSTAGHDRSCLHSSPKWRKGSRAKLRVE